MYLACQAWLRLFFIWSSVSNCCLLPKTPEAVVLYFDETGTSVDTEIPCCMVSSEEATYYGSSYAWAGGYG